MDKKQTLIPRTILSVDGKMHYNESNRSWGKIILKREIVDEFPQLKEKRSTFSYKLMFFRTHEELLNTIKKLNDKEVMPMVFWMYKEKGDSNEK